MLINKIKYYIYSRKYKKIYSSKGIDKISKANYIYLARQNSKSIMSYKWSYIRAVEKYDFKLAKTLNKSYREVFHKAIF